MRRCWLRSRGTSCSACRFNSATASRIFWRFSPGSAWDVFKSQISQTAYLRPLLHVQLKIVYDLAAGNYFPWFRAVQVVQVFAALLLVVRLLRPRHASDLLVVPCCLAMVLGLHTFAGTIREAFPINTFLTLVVCCLAAANLSATRGGCASLSTLANQLRSWRSPSLTLETGVLVWVQFAVGRLYRGLSAAYRAEGRCQLVTAVLHALLYGACCLNMHVGAPGLDERSTGFGFSTAQSARRHRALRPQSVAVLCL